MRKVVKSYKKKNWPYSLEKECVEEWLRINKKELQELRKWKKAAQKLLEVMNYVEVPAKFKPIYAEDYEAWYDAWENLLKLAKREKGHNP